MADNKSARKELERIYGKGCMFDKARVAQRIEAIGGIRTYRKFVEEKHYTSKKLNKLLNNMTFHHLKHSKDGGKSTLENGAVVSEIAHRYIHSLPREQEEIINDNN